MKLKTRLKITFISIVMLPIILLSCAFLAASIYLINNSKGKDVRDLKYSDMSENVQDTVKSDERLYDIFLRQAKEDPSLLEDEEFLKKVESRVNGRLTYIIVRKGKDLYYTGNPQEAQKIFRELPGYGSLDENGKGVYYDSFNSIVHQIDFTFSDGSRGSLFVVNHTNFLISAGFLRIMMIAIVAILVFTGLMITKWIQKGVFVPIEDLNKAMDKIRQGDYDYALNKTIEGEIGELYTNYEAMRLKLKDDFQTEKEQEERNRELIRNISHDLKTPITSIKGYCEGIMDGVADTPQKQEKYIKTIYAKANDMDRLINELTVYSGVDNNRIPYNFHRINISDYFGDCVEEVGLDLESKGIELEYTNMVAKDTLVIADPEQMKKVINNIISNSVKYMDKPKGKIAIRLIDENDSVRIEIEDNGKGIEQKDLTKIFERFYRTDSSRSSAQGGSGIGLSIVKKIVEDHGGYIWASSKEGEGTCMHFVLRKYIEIKE
ncbi:MAG: HAMP domain-containing histidine kinase [Lachnospiraceae bacterium]|nr:HAMP domain-containing histidine kinase [Lachnospiraceae bacterium]